jgi:hypothetical protein
MRDLIAWTAMVLGILSLVTVLKAAEPQKPIAVNPMLAMHLK